MNEVAGPSLLQPPSQQHNDYDDDEGEEVNDDVDEGEEEDYDGDEGEEDGGDEGEEEESEYCMRCGLYPCPLSEVEDTVISKVRNDFNDEVVYNIWLGMYTPVNEASMTCEREIRRAKKKRFQLYRMCCSLIYGYLLGKGRRIELPFCMTEQIDYCTLQ